MTIQLLKNIVQPYAWGSRFALREVLDLPPGDGQPQAEFWMGAHPKGPSRIAADESSLLERIASDPRRYLGADVAERFEGRLPFLFKVLAADQPLSLQAHPTREQARQGYAREEAAGIPLEAPRRNYKDENAKPEVLCALTPFWGLCGFREGDEILQITRAFQLEGIEGLLTDYETSLRSGAGASGSAMRELFSGLFDLSAVQRHRAVSSLVRGAQRILQKVPQELPLEVSQTYWAARWGLRIASLYPDDPGVIAALFLNIVQLEPGEAIFLPPRHLHAYLGGVGLELMASSDNVLRGGLTSKHVDVAELTNVLSFEPFIPSIMKGVHSHSVGCDEVSYPTPASEFFLARAQLDGSGVYRGGAGPEILLCLEGELRVTREDCAVNLTRGGVVFCSAAARPYEVRGVGSLARATVAP